MRVVFDTNVLLSAFLWKKRLKPIYQAIREGKLIPCFTSETWEELLRTLSYKKFKKQLQKIDITPEEIIKLLSSRAYFVASRYKITLIKEDPSDNYFLACALSAQADFIITGDHLLQELKQFQGIPIVSPREFLKKYKKSLERK